MDSTRSSREVGRTTCSSLIVTGAFEDLSVLAKLIASSVNPGDLHLLLTEDPVGWRLQVTSDGNSSSDDAHTLVEQYIREGFQVEIANRGAMMTYIYTAKGHDMSDGDGE